MPKFRLHLPVLPLLLAAALLSGATSARSTPFPSPEAMRKELAAADRALFAAVFDNCDAKALGELVTDDVEFYHDKWGQIAKSRDELVAAINRTCERQRSGEDHRGRRELIEKSVEIHPLNKVGAVQMGRHHFFRVEAGKPDVPTEDARFIHLWRYDAGRWRVARIVSYDHVPAKAAAKSQ